MTYTTTEYKYSNCTVRVHRPVLTEEEREKRMNEIKKAAEKLLREVAENEARKRSGKI